MALRLNNRGFTLVEMVVALAVGALLFGTVMTLCREAVAEFNRQDTRGEVLENLRVGLGALSSELRLATGAPEVDGSGQSISFPTASGRVLYYLHEDQLRRVIDGKGHNPVANHITGFDVTVTDGDGWQLTNLELTGGPDDNRLSLTTRVYTSGDEVDVFLGQVKTQE